MPPKPTRQYCAVGVSIERQTRSMQRPDEKKRRVIAATAARMFATQPFHKVRLDDIAAAAGVGKGTLYIYFDSKEALYFSLIYDAFAQMVERLRGGIGGSGAAPRDRLRAIVAELVGFAFQHPQLFELARTATPFKGRSEAAWTEKRMALTRLLEETIRAGVAAGELADPHPELTALCIPGLVRSVMMFGPKYLDRQAVTAHLVRLLEQGIAGVGANSNGMTVAANGVTAKEDGQ
jgi:AcrR family transcriptional regulator